ncbi:hypothetical protein BT96DRAFT_748707, partial [Gymnopus androsaceus JB14]
EDTCPRCSLAVPLEYNQPQVILTHMAAHILYDPALDQTLQPCGLCLSTTGACWFYLKKGKGADASIQIDWNASRGCPVLKKLVRRFSYKAASESTKASPCSNVPRNCPLCLDKDAPAVWLYNMRQHFLSSHPSITLLDYEHLWKHTNLEDKLMENRWDDRHQVRKKRVLKKTKKQLPLTIS